MVNKYGRSKNPLELNAQGQITTDRRRGNATKYLLISKRLSHTEWHHLFNAFAPHPIIAPTIKWTAIKRTGNEVKNFCVRANVAFVTFPCRHSASIGRRTESFDVLATKGILVERSLTF